MGETYTFGRARAEAISAQRVTFGPPRNSVKTEIVNHSACSVVTDEATRFQTVYSRACPSRRITQSSSHVILADIERHNAKASTTSVGLRAGAVAVRGFK